MQDLDFAAPESPDSVHDLSCTRSRGRVCFFKRGFVGLVGTQVYLAHVVEHLEQLAGHRRVGHGVLSYPWHLAKKVEDTVYVDAYPNIESSQARLVTSEHDQSVPELQNHQGGPCRRHPAPTAPDSPLLPLKSLKNRKEDQDVATRCTGNTGSISAVNVKTGGDATLPENGEDD
ncbi:hypothetical protein CMUS01_15425 [Colletotrichum musicola]|uniref:Uncharacterized protein n=1 Tax=Colletotrichum musicola TaxID=2175873 RepID=A0A8H6IXG4_9PEZI|nr:hypothetical protein CMUS01_15425 [Colletotrichum musicola]